ncbi:uncharacterized protein [Macrobrachium rosenbergii]|uniref:uncharacterized protein isoform X1 n=1 Tax=Macrobrachium rosenbergii TaxID=79674 RepID=UPI0034D658D1
MSQNILLILSLFLHCLTVSGEDGITVTSIEIPPYVERGDDVTLNCCYNLSNYKLYSIKWYRNDKEFFRYITEDDPPKKIFSIPGIDVNYDLSTGESVVLRDVGLNSGGRYKCEVVTDWPGFHTADKSGEMMVVVVPTETPTIEGTQNDYRIGDTARLTCISAASIPAADLTWYINGEEVPNHYLVPIKSTTYANGLVQTRLGLKFDVSRSHFRNGEMTLRCSAQVSSFYRKTQQHSVDGQLTYNVPVMESRDLAAYSGSASVVQVRQAAGLVVAAMLMLTFVGHIQS